MENTNSEIQKRHDANVIRKDNPNYSFTLRDLVGMAFRRRRVIVLAFAGLMAGAIVAILLLPPTYEAEMKILVQRQRVDPLVSAGANLDESDRSHPDSR